MSEAMLVTLLLLQLKHLLADFFWQTQWMVENKGQYGHPGGWAHAAFHGGASAVILAVLAPISLGLVLVICVAECVLHYHIDWIKEQAVKRSGAGPTEKRFWNITGTDQALHQATYLAMAAMIFL
ncbi:MAG: DUF3307 domain-containing protein [Pseudomonadota bacterium]